jgi:hypothetical protein
MRGWKWPGIFGTRHRIIQIAPERPLLDTIQENPLLVAGVGLLVGGLIASALPKSELEENLAGLKP